MIYTIIYEYGLNNPSGGWLKIIFDEKSEKLFDQLFKAFAMLMLRKREKHYVGPENRLQFLVNRESSSKVDRLEKRCEV